MSDPNEAILTRLRDAVGAPEGDKRKAIVEAAARVFVTQGYADAGMDEIAREAGVAKQTLYSHFGSKAQLFEAIIQDRCTQLLGADEDGAAPPAGDDHAAEVALTRAGERFLRVVLDPDSVALFRAIVSESIRFPELAEVFYRAGPDRAVAELAETLRGFDRAGALRVADAEASANMFYAMLKGDIHMRCILGMRENPPRGEIEAWTARVVGDFIAAHRA